MQKLIRELAKQYNAFYDLPKIRNFNNLILDDVAASIISKAYEHTKDNWKDKAVKKAYAQFKRELLDQYKLIKQYIKIEFTISDPYKTSKEMFQDIEKNRRIKVFTGGADHNGLKHVNKIFRAVHDIFGHYINYNSFSANGEYRAYKHHMLMFSPLAQKALFTESIAQVCYYKVNRKYAKQKSIVFDDAFINLV